MNGPATILIADRQAASRDNLRTLLQLDSTIRVVAETDRGVEAVVLTEQMKPDMALVDMELTDMNGLDAIKRIKERVPSVIVILQSESADVRCFFDAIRAGAQGYALKSLDPASLHEYLRSFLIEGASLPSELGRHILQQFVSRGPLNGGGLPVLSIMERTLLEFLCRGYKNEEIADELLLSESAVRIALKDLMFKLGLRNRLQLVRYAFEQGLYPRSQL
ncbi:response regulator [Cohnella fermenti]|nr:response regulator transcription factor [Cohnella fermenti]